MKVKTSELTGAALDWAVAKCEGVAVESFMWAQDYTEHAYQYSINWLAGGPIIEREGIDLYCNVPTNPEHEDAAWRGSWQACYHRCGVGTQRTFGPTALIAAMRAFVLFKLGDEIDIPEELL